MRKLIGTIFLLCLCVGVCSAEEDLYTIVDGKIIARPEYVDTLLGNEKARGYGEYRQVYRDVNSVNVVELYKYAYSDYWKKVLEKNPDAIEDGGDIEIIVIMNRISKKVLHLEYFGGWAKSHTAFIDPSAYPNEEDCYFVMMPVSRTSVAYLFFERSYEQPGYVTVVLSTDKDISVVYQRRSMVEKMTKNSAGQYDRIPLLVEKPSTEYTGSVVQYYEDAIVVENGKLVYKRDVRP